MRDWAQCVQLFAATPGCTGMHEVVWPVMNEHASVGVDREQAFASRLALVLKAVTISRGQLAAATGVDKSVVSRWLSGATVPSEHNLARLTTVIAERIAGFTMLDWEADREGLAAKLGLAGRHDAEIRKVPTAPSDDYAAVAPHLPDFRSLPAFGASLHETMARGGRYCGLWRSWMPTYGRPDAFHCEHLLLRRDGAWLSGSAEGVNYRWPVIGLISNGQLLLIMSDASDLVLRQFNRADEPIVDQVDGLMLAAASLPHQAPTSCRVLMQRVLPPEATEAQMEEELVTRAAERRFLTAEELPHGLAQSLLPDCGPRAALDGGERLLRADPTMQLVRTRWF